MATARTLVGIDHAFSFPLRYFEAHGLPPDWPAFLDDFQHHWPTDAEHMYVDFVRDGARGDGAARMGSSRWRRIADERARAKSVFHFDVPGQVAKSTHAGLPWLRFIRQQLGARVQFWPFDGWKLSGRSVLTEVYPSLWSSSVLRDGAHSDDQHDAFAIVEWLRRAEIAGELAPLFEPALDASERLVASVEGWILGLSGGPTPPGEGRRGPGRRSGHERDVGDREVSVAGRRHAVGRHVELPLDVHQRRRLRLTDPACRPRVRRTAA